MKKILLIITILAGHASAEFGTAKGLHIPKEIAPCFSYIKEKHRYLTKTQILAGDMHERCVSGEFFDFRIWNSVDSDNHIDDFIIHTLSRCDYDKQITQHKNGVFTGFTCILK